MTAHDRILDLAAAAIDFDLSPAEQATLERHLASCPVCRRQVARLRADAVAIAALSQPRLGLDRSADILSRVLAPPRTTVRLRILLVAVLVAVLAATLALAVGAELLRRSRDNPVLPPTLVVRQSPEPSRPKPSDAKVAFSAEAFSDLPDVGASPLDAASDIAGRLVIVGSGECVLETCSVPFLSAESAERGAWSPMARAHETPDYRSVTIEAVAGGGDGFVAIGRGCVPDLNVLACIWRLGDAAETWDLLPKDPIFERAALKAVAATPYGWIIGGGVYPDGPPRAAVWRSRDGRAWQRIADGPAFDIGGQRDVDQGPDDIIVGQGGIDDLASDGTTVVAVGSTCDPTGARCSPAAWATDDGRSWTRSTGLPSGPEVGSLGIVVATSGGYIAFGRMAPFDSDPDRDGHNFVARSDDGIAWRTVTTGEFSAAWRPVAAAAVDDGVAVAMTQGPSMKILGTRDGVSWEIVHDYTWEPVAITTPSLRDPSKMVTSTTAVEAVVMTERPDGSAIVVGLVMDPPDGAVRSRFVYRVVLGPAGPT